MRRLVVLASAVGLTAWGTTKIVTQDKHKLAPSLPVQTEGTAAICLLRPDGGSGVEGKIILTQDAGLNQPTRIFGTVTGLTPGKHGFHVHEYGMFVQMINL
jgi:Cu/Zn superoxide dismutase